ncbi:P-loop containing nucleoside triphosphate hydrolase protein, partial [Cyathus striatus]
MFSTAEHRNKKVWNEQEKAIIRGDTILEDGRSSDIVILCMTWAKLRILGPQGVGKSTFINKLVGRNEMKAVDDRRACTTNIQHTIMNNPRNPDQRLVIVDTPSFDLVHDDNMETLRQFSVWLAPCYIAGAKIGGVIYLQDVSAGFRYWIAHRNLEIYQKLCGPDSFHSWILGTTKWDRIEPSAGRLREERLSNDYWKYMIDRGSLTYRFENTRRSAWNMVDKILDGV